MVELVMAAERFNLNYEREESRKAAEQVSRCSSKNSLTPEIGKLIHDLWQDEAVRQLYPTACKTFHINDTAHYFFDNILTFLKPDYIPSTDDILRVRVRSTGIEEAEFKYDKTIYKFVDVGGQRSERRKWIHCFDDVTAVLFCASLCGYDQVLREDSKTYRMVEALNLYEAVVNDDIFARSAMILFLNKTDLFRDKITKVDLSILFPNYSGGPDFEKACQFIASRFKELIYNDVKVFIHFTCAINTENIDHVINSVRVTILDENLGKIFGNEKL